MSCAQIRANNERHYYKQTLWVLKSNPDPNNLCGYDFDVPYPLFNADENIATDWDRPSGPEKKRPHLSERIIINYNPAQMEKIRHESVHYLNRMKRSSASYLVGVSVYEKVSWDCLDELSAQLVAENLMLRDLLGIQKAKTRYYRHR